MLSVMLAAMNPGASKPDAPKVPISHAARRGMTLIELLAVMVVALILISISVPALISIGRGYG